LCIVSTIWWWNLLFATTWHQTLQSGQSWLRIHSSYCMGLYTVDTVVVCVIAGVFCKVSKNKVPPLLLWNLNYILKHLRSRDRPLLSKQLIYHTTPKHHKNIIK
jgi:hypothetical protein